jgi:hypothetical protein
MPDRTATIEEAPHSPADLTGDRPPSDGDALRERIQRLEDAIASIQDTRLLEDRLVERLSERLQRPAPALPAEKASQHVREAEPRAPVAVPFRAERPPRYEPFTPPVTRSPWLIFEIYSEVRTIVRMFLDRRYRMGWAAFLVAVALIPFILTSHWWVPFTGLPVIGPIFDKVIDLLLALVAFKVLSHEALRYREFLAAQEGSYRVL